MTAIHEQIKALQRKLAKAELLEKMKTDLQTTPDPQGHAGLSKEAVDPILAFIDAQIAALTGDESPKSSTPSSLTSEEVSVVKQFVNRLQSRLNDAGATSPAQSPKPVEPKQDSARQDKLRFAMQNQKLAGKRVMCHTKDGDVKGEVVGLDAPYVLVKTDTGYTVPLELEQVTLI